MYDTSTDCVAASAFEELSSDDAWHFPWKIIKRNESRLSVLLAGKEGWWSVYGPRCAVKSPRPLVADSASGEKLFRFALPLASRIIKHFLISTLRALLSRRKEQKKKLHDDVSLHSLCRHLRHNVHLSFADFTYFCCACLFLFPVWSFNWVLALFSYCERRIFLLEQFFVCDFGYWKFERWGRCGAGVDWSLMKSCYRRAKWRILETRLLLEISQKFMNFDVELQRNSSPFLVLVTSLPHISHSRENKLK